VNVSDGPKRVTAMRAAIRLEVFTVGWNLLEGAVALAAAIAAGSVALLGFGADSFIESASGAVMIWRLTAERSGGDPQTVEGLERRARKLVALSLIALAGYVTLDAVHALWARQRPEVSKVGIGLTIVSLFVMMWLARAKRRAALAIASRAMQADAFQTTACWWLSLITLAGIALNGALGWWWGDPAAALGMVPLVLREAREAWRGDDCCRLGEHDPS
jgi:divalent metal cation (Fe/Co/Zn/Cd) transporter